MKQSNSAVWVGVSYYVIGRVRYFMLWCLGHSCCHSWNQNILIIYFSVFPPSPAPVTNVHTRTYSHYQIIVIILPIGQTVDDLRSPNAYTHNDLKPYDEEFCNREHTSPEAYITAEYSRELIPPSKLFIVGNADASSANSPNDRSNTYTNGPLCYEFTYTFFIRAFPAVDTQVR